MGGSEDASYLYFITTAHELYVEHDAGSGWQRSGIATLSGDNEDEIISPGNGHAQTGFASACLAERPLPGVHVGPGLTGFDNRDADEQPPAEETGRQTDDRRGISVLTPGRAGLACASCDPTGARPTGSNTALKG